MKDFVLEVCVDSLESAMNAYQGGGNRLELCANLIIGGTTPSVTLFKQIKESCDIKINVLIRPRFGDFCYSDSELEQIREDILAFKELGANGVVIGVLIPEGKLDVEKMKPLMEAAEGMEVTLHRAFDMCDDYMEALDAAAELGIHTILTSGGKNNAIDGAELLAQLIEKNKVDILIGSGVSLSTIGPLYEATHGKNYHMSGKVVLDSKMIYRNQEVFMGLDGISEYSIFQTSENNIREAQELLSSLGEE